MTISALPPVPNRSSSPDTFAADSDALLGALPTFRTEANAMAAQVQADADAAAGSAAAAAGSAGTASAAQSAASASAASALASAAAAISAPGTNATSSTTLTVSAGSKSLTVETGKTIVVGMSVKIANTSAPTTWMHGDITSYNSGTGALTVNVTTISGSGSASAWVISLSAPAGGSADWSAIANKPTTVAGYGITDAAPKNETFNDVGTVAAGTATINLASGLHQRVQASGNITVAVTGWPAAGKLGEVLVEFVNFGGKTITWPAVNWIKADGTVTTTFGSNGVTLQAAGTDFCVLWTRDGGTTIYGKFVR